MAAPALPGRLEEALAWELMKLLSAGGTIQKELYTYSHGISPIRSAADWRDKKENVLASQGVIALKNLKFSAPPL